MPSPGAVVAIGTEGLIAGFALAGVTLLAADTGQEVCRAWENLAPGTGLVLLTADAATALGDRPAAADAPLSVVMPR